MTPMASTRTFRSGFPTEVVCTGVVCDPAEMLGVVGAGAVPLLAATTRTVAVPCGRASVEVAAGMKTTEIGTSIVEVPASIGVTVSDVEVPTVNALPQGIALARPLGPAISNRKPLLH